jgi:pimeloyl-ACP methyl ester carboxylesterase
MLANREQYMAPLKCRDLGALHTGVLLVSGERSAPVFHAISAELARCLQNDSTVTIPGAGHAMHASNPAYYNQVVLRYLATH